VRRIGLALEWALGHVTHGENLMRQMPESIDPYYVKIPYTVYPKLKNWSLRASLHAWRMLKSAGPLEGLFYHTQITTLFAAPLLRKTPGVVSLDATPVQMDVLGAAYGHKPGSPRIEALKKRLLLRTLNEAGKIVTWSQWTKDSLIDDYNQPAEKIIVVPPGVDSPPGPLSVPAPTSSGTKRGSLRALFVGGDFARKGGEELLGAWERLRPDARLDIVTQSEVRCDLPGVQVHRGIKPNSSELRALFSQADLFVFPTRADCLPLAVLEAAAAGLPTIATGVGALPEAVIHGETGKIVSVGDTDALALALGELLEDPDERRRMGERARELACTRFDSAKNYRKLMELIPATCR
jgi:glycosyltransferase involved in cell wall biosynthesis